MKILAIEFSTDLRSVALHEGGRVLASATETADRTTHAFALIENALAEAHWEREQINCIAVGIGPGSYTGIRTALALAQGWQLAANVKLLGISSAECLAAEAQTKGLSGKTSVVIDAQRNEFYLARYEINSTNHHEIAPLRLASIDEVKKQITLGDIVVGPEVKKWFSDGHVIYPGAATLGKLAVQRNDFIAGEKLEPIYLRETNFVKAPPSRILPA